MHIGLAFPAFLFLLSRYSCIVWELLSVFFFFLPLTGAHGGATIKKNTSGCGWKEQYSKKKKKEKRR